MSEHAIKSDVNAYPHRYHHRRGAGKMRSVVITVVQNYRTSARFYLTDSEAVSCIPYAHTLTKHYHTKVITKSQECSCV